jgi:ketosteroid isomerase-like protein
MDPRKTYRRWLLQLGQGDEAAADVLADDVVAHWPDREVAGREQLVGIIESTRAMFDELTFELEVGPLVDGDLVAARWSGVGRAADGEERAFLGHDVMRLRDGRIAEYWVVSWTGPH